MTNMVYIEVTGYESRDATQPVYPGQSAANAGEQFIANGRRNLLAYTACGDIVTIERMWRHRSTNKLTRLRSAVSQVGQNGGLAPKRDASQQS